MKANIEKRTFIELLKKIGKTIDNFSPLPSLQYVKMELNDDSVILTASNTTTSIIYLLKDGINIKEPGTALLKYKELNNIVKNIDGEEVKLTSVKDSAMVKINGKKARFKLNGINNEEFPNIMMDTTSQPITIKSDTLISLISKSSFATSDKLTRPVLTGVNIEGKNDRLLFTATDAYRAVRETLDIKIPQDFRVTVASEALSTIVEFVKDAKNIEIYPEDKNLFFKSDNFTIKASLIEGGYPDVERLLQESTIIYNTTLEKDSFLETMKRATVLTGPDSTVRLDFSAEDIILKSDSTEVGTFEESINDDIQIIDGRGDFYIALSAKYLSEALKTSSQQKLNIKFSGEVKPVYFYDEDEANGIKRTQIVLPIRTR